MLVFELFWYNLDMEWQGNPPLSLTKTKWVIICDFISYFMCNVGQHISKTSMATPQLFYIDVIQVLQRILLQFFKQIVSYFYILGVSPLKRENHQRWFPSQRPDKQRVLMHGHQGWNVRHGLCHIYMIYVYIWVVYSFCLFCCLFIIVTTQFVALYKPCKPKPKPVTYDPPDNHPLAEIQRPILRLEPKQQICHQHANTDHFGK